MKRILFALTIILILLSSVVPVSAERDLRIGDVVDINGMKATIVGFQGKQPIYQSIIAPNIYGSASDGQIYYSGSVYATVRTSATGSVSYVSNAIYVQNFYLGGYYAIARGYLYFDTSSLVGYVVTAATLNVYLDTITDANNESIQVQSGMATYPHDPLVTGDFDLTNYAGDGGSKDITTFINKQYNAITLNATGYGWINTSGWTKYCLRTTGDINNVTPTGSNSISFLTRDYGSNYPYLSVTYTAVVPVIISVAASSVATTSARLNSSITDDGGDPTCQIEFGYGLVSEPDASHYADYTTHTAVTVPVSDYAEGTNPYLDVSGLTPATPYFYRVKITNEFGSVVSVDEQTFPTEAVVSEPSIFNGIPNDTSISLAFVRGTGSTQTLIRFALDTYPATTADGTQIYLDTGSNYIHSGLTGGTTYYYSAWGKSGATYSASAINLAMTTTDSLGDNDLPAAGAIGGLMQEPDETFLVHLQPFYSVLNGLADTWGMPRGNMWLALVLIFIFLVCGGLYIRFHSASLSLILMAMLMGGFVTLHILPTLFVIVIGFCILGAWATRPSL